MILDVATMKSILDKLPGDYEIEFQDDHTVHPISNKIEIDISGKTIILKSR